MVTNTKWIRAATVEAFIAALEEAKRDGWACVEIAATVQRQEPGERADEPAVIQSNGGGNWHGSGALT